MFNPMWKQATIYQNLLYEVGVSLVAQLKNPPANAGNIGSIPGLRRSPEEGSGNPFQFSCLGNPMDRGAWLDTVHGVSKSWM